MVKDGKLLPSGLEPEKPPADLLARTWRIIPTPLPPQLCGIPEIGVLRGEKVLKWADGSPSLPQHPKLNLSPPAEQACELLERAVSLSSDPEEPASS